MDFLGPALGISKCFTTLSQHLGHDIKFLSVNVCGLYSKQLNPGFMAYINKFDVIGFQETKTDSLDSINLENVALFLKHR